MSLTMREDMISLGEQIPLPKSDRPNGSRGAFTYERKPRRR